MATLTNTKIKDTYDGLLKTTDNEALDVSGVTLIEDGLGNASALSVGRSGNGVTITGSLNATLATAAQPNITSVGTLSSLSVSGNLAVDTNTLYVDAANNRVGIGTSSPDKNLEVLVGGINQSSTIRITGSDGAGGKHPLDLKMDGATDTFSILIGTGGGATPSTVLFAGNRNGNVGIGISNPDSYDSNADNLVIGSTGASDKNGITIVGGDTDGRSAVYFADTTQNSAGFLTYFHSNNSMLFGTSDTERMRIDSSGNVGIGVVPSNYAGYTTLCLNDTSGSQVEFFSSGVQKAYIEGTAGILKFQHNDASPIVFSTNATERMRIDSSGNVGIGVTPNTSYSRLQIKATDSVYALDLIGRNAGTEGEAQITFWNSAQSTVQGYITQDNGNMLFGAGIGATERMRIDSSGNVLIDTTGNDDALLNLGDRSQSPVRRLQLGQEVNFFTVAANDPSLQVGESQRLTFSFTNSRTTSIIELDVIQDYTASNSASNHQSAKVIFHVYMTSGSIATLNASTLVSGNGLDLTDFTFTDNSNGTFTIDIINNLGDPNVTQYVGVKITGATCNLISSTII